MGRVTKSWIVENTWKCTSCGHVNKGREMKCTNCGSPREKGEADVPSAPSAPPVIDPGLLKKATAGRHWICKFCRGQERASNGTCANCGARQDERTPLPLPPPPRRESTPTARTLPLPPPPSDPHRITGDRRWPWIVGIGAVVFGVTSLFFWLFLPHKVHATVSEMTWTHTAFLEQRETRHAEDWGSPSGSFNVSCERKLYGHEDCNPHQCNAHTEQYQCGSHDCNCSDQCTPLSNGFSSCSRVCSSCPDYCSRTVYDTCYDQCEVFKDWCRYDYYAWPVIDQQTLTGAGRAVKWPALAAKSDLQRTRQEAHYQVSFTDGKKVWKHKPQALADYQLFEVNAPWEIKVNRAGSVWPLRAQ